MKMRLLVSAAILAVGTAACKDAEVKVYDVPKENRQDTAEASNPPPPPQAPAASPMANMRGQNLPENSLSSADNPTWKMPDTWRLGPQSNIRRGSFAAGPANAEADIAVTVFPGDVGGLLANVNRWRQQVGLPPTTATGLEDLVQSITIDGREAQLVEFGSDSIGTMAAIVMENGQSWFVRMTAPPATITSERENFLSFLQSLQFPQ